MGKNLRIKFAKNYLSEFSQELSFTVKEISRANWANFLEYLFIYWIISIGKKKVK